MKQHLHFTHVLCSPIVTKFPPVKWILATSPTCACVSAVVFLCTVGSWTVSVFNLDLFVCLFVCFREPWMWSALVKRIKQVSYKLWRECSISETFLSKKTEITPDQLMMNVRWTQKLILKITQTKAKIKQTSVYTRNKNFADVPSPWSSEGLFGGQKCFYGNNVELPLVLNSFRWLPGSTVHLRLASSTSKHEMMSRLVPLL